MNKRFAKLLFYFIVSFLCSFFILSPSVAQAAEPQITASAAVLLDMDSGAVLWEKNSREALPPASTTKILTAILALDMVAEDSKYLVTPQAAAIGESTIDLVAGQTFTVGELLRGALIASGNDAAYALGEAAAVSEGLFIHWLNVKGAVLGATSIDFYNANGLPNTKHVISAYDLAIITRYAMDNERFSQIVKLQTDVIGQNATRRYLKNTNKLLRSNEAVIGVKTGTTDAAGACLVAAMQRDGRRVLAVVFHSPDRFGECLQLLNYGIDEFYNINVAKRGDVLSILPQKKEKPIALLAANDGCFTIPKKVQELQVNWAVATEGQDGFDKQTPFGFLQIIDDTGKLWGEVALVSAESRGQKGFSSFLENFIEDYKKLLFFIFAV